MEKTRARPVRCIETGEVFPSAKAASLAIGKAKGAVSLVLTGYTKTAGGYTWEYADGGDVTYTKTHKPHRPHHKKPSEPKQAPRPRTAPSMTIPEVMAEARRRTAMTGVYHGYGDIQKEETVRLLKEGKLCKSKTRKR